MAQHLTHPWNLSYREARQLQETLAGEVSLIFPGGDIRLIAGADVSFSRFSPILYAGIVVLTFPGLSVVEKRWGTYRTAFPYIPGYLSFREAPAVLAVFEKLRHRPDVMILDGQGIAHPRGLGLASHVGLILNLPTIGCAKSLLVGEFSPLPAEKGSASPLEYKGRRVGMAVRTRSRIKPVFVSPGHLMDFEHATEIVLQCCPKFRIPEPTRQAHRLVNQVRKEHEFPQEEI